MLQICLVKIIPVNDEVCPGIDLYEVLFFDPLCFSLLFICDLRVGVFMLLVTQAFGNMVLSGLWMTQDTLAGVMLLLLAIFIIVFFYCLLVYIADLHTVSEEKSNLLSKMQEGVLILDKPSADELKHTK